MTLSVSISIPDKYSVTGVPRFVGAGKTTVFNQIINNQQVDKVAVIINDMSEIVIDSATVINEVILNRSEVKLFEVSNGCIK